MGDLNIPPHIQYVFQYFLIFTCIIKMKVVLEVIYDIVL